jgi:hypothetical protein
MAAEFRRSKYLPNLVLLNGKQNGASTAMVSA